MSGEGTEADRKETKGRLRAAQSERSAVQSEVNQLQRSVDGTTSTLTVEQIRERLSEMSTLLSVAAAGELGEDAVYKALAVFRSLTGGQIWVRVEQRKNRKRTNVLGTFLPRLVMRVYPCSAHRVAQTHSDHTVAHLPPLTLALSLALGSSGRLASPLVVSCSWLVTST